MILASRTLVALLLIASGVVKFFELGSFVGTVRAFALLPNWVVPSVARAIPIGESLTGAVLSLAVVVPYSAARWAALAAIGLFVVFTGAVAINLMRGRRNISCGCFGANESRISWLLVVRNCVLAGISYLAFQSISYPSQAVVFGERMGSLLVGLSMLLIWQLTVVIVRLNVHDQNEAEG
ncbi:MAG TPA: MauE/DoxX family redox-associated membrane protein [Candidatus Angelobacter sp.]|jgi:hypothetical protein